MRKISFFAVIGLSVLSAQADLEQIKPSQSAPISADAIINPTAETLETTASEMRREIPPEQFYPLHAFVCETCFLVQLDEFVEHE